MKEDAAFLSEAKQLTLVSVEVTWVVMTQFLFH